MQFSIVGSPSTWDRYGVDGNRDGRRSPYDPEDAIPAAARYLRASGAPADYSRAIFAYNHADWYVADVLAQAELYRGAATGTAGSPGETASVRELLANPRIVLTPGQRADLRARRHRPAAARDAGVDRPPPHRRDHRAARRPLPGHQPRGRPRDGHRRRRRRDLPRHPHRRLRRAGARARRRRPARRARPSSSTAGTPTVRSTRAASRAPITATTSTGAWTRDAATRRP